MKQVAHLHFHSEYSIQDSIIRNEQLAAAISRCHIKALALTDHGTVDGAIQFYQAVKKTKAVPILGCEFYVVNDKADRTDKHRWHAVLLAKNRRGFSSIMKALTVANMEGFYYRPRIDWKYLLDEIEDCVYLTACEAGVLSHPSMGDLVPRLVEKFGEDFYWEAICIKDYPPQHEYSVLLRDMQKLVGGKIVFTNDVHYLERGDWKAREVIRRLGFNQKMSPDEPEPAGLADLHLKSYEEMVQCALDLGFESPEVTMSDVWDEIAAKCSWDFSPLSPSVPLAYEEARENPGAFLRELCYQRIAEDESLGTPEVLERTDRELTDIIGLGFVEYFLLVRELVLWAKANGCMVGPGRGSVGGSLVAYLLGITGINPLDYGLMWERFISPDRHDLPDIDLDFEDTERDRVIQHMRDKYGARSVAYVSTFSTSKGRGSVRDVSRVFGVPLVEVDQIAKQILQRSGGDARADFSLEDTVALFENAKEFASKYPYVISVCKRIEGNIKTKGIHAAGLVVDTEDLYTGNKCVMVRTKSGELAVNWDKYDIEFAGIMKIDALGLKTLNVLKLAKEEIKRRHGADVDYASLPLDDPAVIDAFYKADTVGVFQFGSAGMIQYLRNFKAKNFGELIQANSLFRPGTLRSGMASKFILHKTGVEKPTYINAQMKALLEETYGIVLYQEQMMQILNRLSGIPWRTVDVIRKVVSKSQGQEKFESFRKEWLAGVQRLESMSAEDANKAFSLMKFFGSYGFNKSHSAEYTMLGYYTMWLKVKYPTEFFCATLRRSSDKEEIVTVLTDAGRHGMKIKSPDINASGDSWTIEDTGVLRGGFDIIKGISERSALDLVKARGDHGGVFTDIFDFVANIPRRSINIGKIKALLRAKTLDGIVSEEDRKKIVLYIEAKKKFPIREQDYKELDASTYIEEDVLSYEMPENWLEQNKALVALLTNHFQIKKLTHMAGKENEAILPQSYYLGRFDAIKFGFRAKVEGAHGTGSDVDVKGYASDLGGVYGIFRDDSSHVYSTVTGKLYHSNLKADIEDIAGRVILMRANKPQKTSNIFMSEFQFAADIKNGNFGMINPSGILPMAAPSKEEAVLIEDVLIKDVKNCRLCPARGACKAPVPLIAGQFQSLLIGEAPGADEDQSGKPFVGRAGAVLWSALERRGLSRDLFSVTNVLKCRPKDNKIIDQEVPVFCGDQWLKKEVSVLKPRLILSLGKTALRFVTGDIKAGILDRNATVEWNERLGAWVVYSVHPAMALYAPENLAILDAAVQVFADLFLKMI